MPEITTRRVVLNAPITGVPALSDFRLESVTLAPPGDRQFLVRNVFCSADPGTRSRLSAGVSYTSHLAAGDLVSSFAIGRVMHSRHPDYADGDWIVHASGWSDHQLCDGRGYLQKLDPAWTSATGREQVPLSAWIGVLGIPGMTAWFGMHRVAGVKPGERVLVSSAAGPVGATAGQVARRIGAACVVGIAGGADKCAWLRDEAGFDHTIDYKALRAAAAADIGGSGTGTGMNIDARYAQLLQARLQAASPDGFDVLFDNVGNTLIDAVIPLMRAHGRIVISGTVADYNRPADQMPGLFNTRHFIARRLRMEGILVFDDRREFPAAQAQMAQWLAQHQLAWREQRFEGIEQLPAAFVGLFTGDQFGRRVVRVGPDGP